MSAWVYIHIYEYISENINENIRIHLIFILQFVAQNEETITGRQEPGTAFGSKENNSLSSYITEEVYF